MQARLLGAALFACLSVSTFPARAQACSKDVHEPDDACPVARILLPGAPQPHDFCDDAEDWVTFNACAGRVYTIATSALGPGADTVLELLDAGCGSVLATDDNGGGGLASHIDWTATGDGVLHARVRQANGSSGPG